MGKRILPVDQHQPGHIMVFLRWMLVGVICLFSLHGQSQKPAIWTFGNHSGLNFTYNNPIILDSSAIQQEMVRGRFTYSSSICNKYGDLLLYTDGFTVWERHHEVVPKFEFKWPWTEHIVPLLCPYPGNDSMYYLFGVSTGSYQNQLQYLSIKAKVSGSFPEIIYPMPSTFSNYYTVLKKNASMYVAGTIHCNRHDMWVVTHSQDAFYSYLITDNGVSTTPVVSAIPDAVMSAGWYDDLNIKFSANGEKLLVPLKKQRKVVVFDFNNQTGAFSNPVVISMQNDNQIDDAELSPDGTKLYIAWWMPYPSPAGGEIHNIAQYDLEAGTDDQIAKSFYGVVGDSARTNFCGGKICFNITRTMELGPDANIYVSEEYKVFPTNPDQPQVFHIGQMTNVNDKGSRVKYRYNALSHDTRNPLYIKYNYVRSTVFTVKENGIQYENRVCNNTPVRFSLLFKNVDSVKWNFGDSASGLNNFSTALYPEHLYPGPGIYNASAVLYTKCFIDTAYAEVIVTEKPLVQFPDSITDTTLCIGKDFFIDASTANAIKYEWSNKVTEPSQTISKAGTYWVAASNECNADTASFTVSFDSCNCKVFVPSAFTPNGDQLNDLFRPIVDCNGFGEKSNYIFRVYNRFGQVIFASTIPGVGWNGRYHDELLQSGNYQWIVQYNNPNNNEFVRKSGTVTLIR